MIRKLLIFAAAVSGVAAFALNLDRFILGGRPSALAFASSLAYIVLIFALCIVPGGKKSREALAVYTGALTLLAVAAAIVAHFRLTADFLLLPLIIFMPPYYGIRLLLSSQTIASVVAVICLLATAVNIILTERRR